MAVVGKSFDSLADGPERVEQVNRNGATGYESTLAINVDFDFRTTIEL